MEYNAFRVFLSHRRRPNQSFLFVFRMSSYPMICAVSLLPVLRNRTICEARPAFGVACLRCKGDALDSFYERWDRFYIPDIRLDWLLNNSEYYILGRGHNRNVRHIHTSIIHGFPFSSLGFFEAKTGCADPQWFFQIHSVLYSTSIVTSLISGKRCVTCCTFRQTPRYRVCSCSNIYGESVIVWVASSLYAICKAFLVIAFVEHAAIRISCRCDDFFFLRRCIGRIVV